MTSPRRITLFHAPNTRSSVALTLLEELDADYQLQVLDMKSQEQRSAAYLAINPMGKVPAIRHGEAIVTEQVAIFLYLADLYAESQLAPPPADPQRGPYLRWLVFYGSCFEPAVIDRAMKRDPGPVAMSPYGDFDTLLRTLTDQLGRGEYLLGSRFTAADVLWGSSLSWMLEFELVPELPVLTAYANRITTRPAARRAKGKDVQLVAAQGA